MEFTNTYSGGLDKDISYLKYPKNKYYHLQNFRVVTNEGSSTGAIENEKGNQLDFEIPTTQPVVKILDGSGVLNINGKSILIREEWTIEEIYEEILKKWASEIGTNFNVFLSDDYILLFGLNLLTVSGNNTLFQTVVPLLTNHRIIHMDHFNDYIVIFTTSNTTANPTSANGQIWLIDYNEETNTVNNLNGNLLNPAFHLKYNNLLNLSTEHYIRKSICRYENSNIARVYWTDYYNPVRSFNLFDPLAYAIEPGDLDFINDITFSKPKIKTIKSGGQIPTGSVVQFYYQLLSSGRETIISPGSELLPIYSGDSEVDTYRTLEGNPANNNFSKAVDYVISNLDPNFDTIRHIAVIYQYKDTPVIKMFREEFIPPSREINVTFTDTEDSILLTEQELNILNTQFSVCKDLAHKDNRLIAVNTKSTKFDIEDSIFDARAYRFKKNQTCKIKNKSNVLLTVDNTFNVPSEHDAINPFNNENDPFYDLYKFKSDGVTLGGEGKYISYEFITRDITNDELGLATGPQIAGMDDGSREQIIEGDQTFIKQFNHFKSPFVHMLYGGYMRDEVYRFGIVFYNKKGNVSFVKWIGDIKIPDITEIPLNEVRNSPNTGNPALYAKQIGIQFNINIPQQLQDLISGYEIVRVERKMTDKSRITGGLVYAPYGLSLMSSLQSFKPSTGSIDFLGSSSKLFAFISPWHQFNTVTNADFQTGDFIRLNMYYKINTNDTDGIDVPSVNGIANYYKLRNSTNFYKKDINLKGSKWVARGASIDITNTIDPGSPYSTYENKRNFSGSVLKHGPHYVFASLAGFNPGAFDDIIPYGTYCRNIQNQYGGNTYEDRSLNVYIATNSFINNNQSNILDVFGGDTYCNYFDYEYVQANDVGTTANKTSSAVMFTCESPFNVDMRYGNHYADDRDFPGNPEWLDYTDENYLINPVYLQENNGKQTFIAKPFNVNLDDEQPYAIWVSEQKFNGEQIDNWVKFSVNNQIEVDGIFGPINGVINHQGRVYFLQNEAVGIVPINERIVTQNTDGIELSLGTGDVISVYGYVSTKTGCFHTSSIVQTEDYFYFFDARRKKFYRMSLDSKQPLSDIKGLSSYFNTYIKESPLENVDSKTSMESIGIHGCYDPRYNRVLYTLNKGYFPITLGNRPTLDGITISYNEFLNAFESFYSFVPSIYLSTGRKLLSVDAKQGGNRNKVYQHDKGNYGEFYDITYDSTLTLCVNAENTYTKEFNNVIWYSECYDNNLTDVPNETFNSIRVFNDHQTTGFINLSQGKIARFFRFWRHAIQRDINSPQQQARIRNPWILLELSKSNINNNRFVAHDITTYYLL